MLNVYAYKTGVFFVFRMNGVDHHCVCLNTGKLTRIDVYKRQMLIFVKKKKSKLNNETS